MNGIYPIEIRFKKKQVLALIALFSFITLGFDYYIFFYNDVPISGTSFWLTVLFHGFMVFQFFVLGRKILRDTPVISIDRLGMEVNRGLRTKIILWQDLLEWKIDRDAGESNYYLRLRTNNGDEKIDLSSLDKSPDEIREVLNQVGQVREESI